MRIQLTKEFLFEQYFEQNKSTIQISNETNWSQTQIKKKLREYGFKLRSKNRIGRGNNYKRFNENYFKNIDDEHKAYWLGFIAADGCICDTTSLRLQIILHKKDIDHLNKLKSDLESKHNILTYGDYSRIIHNSPKLCNDLIRHGCPPRKSLILKFPSIEQNLIRHWIRGYFDGDGCFYYNPKDNRIRLNFKGTEDVLNGIQKHIDTNIKLQKPSNIFSLHISGNRQVSRILNYLFDDCTIYLNRKMELIKEYL